MLTGATPISVESLTKSSIALRISFCSTILASW
uniref:Uncharacterized protein n=1 Tax=virus sp. ctPYc18 TaxID=2828251 RepID=A0A8S5RDK3_9VIRU|nr:MAG TPA: hypothetical protein [virus sp. ctPYc18]